MTVYDQNAVKACQYAEEAAALSPNNPIFVGWCLYRLSITLQFKKGLKIVEKALKTFDGNISIHMDAGKFYCKYGNFKKSQQQYNKCFEIDEEYPDLNVSYAYLLYEMKKYNEAIERVKNRSSGGSWCVYGMCLRKLNQFDKAEFQFKKSIRGYSRSNNNFEYALLLHEHLNRTIHSFTFFKIACMLNMQNYERKTKWEEISVLCPLLKNDMHQTLAVDDEILAYSEMDSDYRKCKIVSKDENGIEIRDGYTGMTRLIQIDEYLTTDLSKNDEIHSRSITLRLDKVDTKAHLDVLNNRSSCLICGFVRRLNEMHNFPFVPDQILNELMMFYTKIS